MADVVYFRSRPKFNSRASLGALVRGIYFEEYRQANRIPRTVPEDLLRRAVAGKTLPAPL